MTELEILVAMVEGYNFTNEEMMEAFGLTEEDIMEDVED